MSVEAEAVQLMNEFDGGLSSISKQLEQEEMAIARLGKELARRQAAAADLAGAKGRQEAAIFAMQTLLERSAKAAEGDKLPAVPLPPPSPADVLAPAGQKPEGEVSEAKAGGPDAGKNEEAL